MGPNACPEMDKFEWAGPWYESRVIASHTSSKQAYRFEARTRLDDSTMSLPCIAALL